MKGTLAILIALPVALAPQAHANPDNEFVYILHERGLDLPNDPSVLGDAGRLVCKAAANGYNAFDVRSAVEHDFHLSEMQATRFVSAAVQTYCPTVM